MGRAHSVELALYGGLMGLCPAAVLAFFGYMFATSACHAMPQPCLLKSLSFPCAQQHSHSHPLQDMLRAGLQPASQSTADREHFVEQHCVLLSAAMPCSNRQHRSRSSLAWAFQCVSGSILPPQNDAAFQSKHSTQRLLSHPKSSCLNVDFTKMSVPILLQHDLVSTFLFTRRILLSAQVPIQLGVISLCALLHPYFVATVRTTRSPTVHHRHRLTIPP